MKRLVFLLLPALTLAACTFELNEAGSSDAANGGGIVIGSAPEDYDQAVAVWEAGFNNYLGLPSFGFKAFASTGNPLNGQLGINQIGNDAEGASVIPFGFSTGFNTQEEAEAAAIANCTTALEVLNSIAAACRALNVNDVDL